MGSLEKRFPKYNRLLKFYPASYQRHYRQAMLQTLADMLDDQENNRSIVWLKVSADLPISLFRQNLIYVGDVMKNDTPHYVKRNLLIETLLLVPFFSLVIINSLSGSALDFTNNWKRLFTWLIIGLPLVASVLGIATLARWVAQQNRGFWESLLDFRRNWLMFLVTGLAFLIVIFVPFHDSGKCVTGNPVHELRNFRDTWHCVESQS